MIQANELRLNNHVMHDGRHFQIFCLAQDAPYLNTSEFGVGIVTYNNIYPIPLSPDILEKAGFKPNAVGDLSIEINDISTHLELREANGLFYPSIDQMQDIGSPQNVALNCIQYLHQLQNIIHALTGQELTITLTPNTNL